MYPSTTFIIEDRSAISALPIDGQISAPLFAQFFSSDKGPEEMGVYYGEEFKIFGSPNFTRHGQPLLQAQVLINNGARVLAKRIVAPDATLANLVVVAKVNTVPESQVQKTNAAGELLYTTAEGEETTDAQTLEGESNTPVMITIPQKCKIAYELQTITGNMNDIEDLKASTLALADYEGKGETDEKKYPLFLIADNGRGVSAKKFNITANVQGSRNKSYLSYIFSVIEDSTVSESTLFTLDPNIATSTSNLALESVAKTYLKEVRVFTFDDVMTEFLATIKTATGIEDINNIDVLFGRDKKGNALNTFDVSGANLSIPVGVALESGSNGSFNNLPLKSADYATQMVEAFNGTFTKDIYDVDNILLDGIIDANYPDQVKKAIEGLIEFREDAFFFRDLGTALYSADDIMSKASEVQKSRYIGIYGNSYDVIDPYSKKQITVTIGYSLARLLPAHFVHRRANPVAGFLNKFVFDEIVEGTVNFLPKVIPGKNEKEELFANHVNFISYLDGTAVMESQYTSQAEFTGFSYINNTLAVQEVVKAIRIRCPKARYTFMEEEDLVRYQEDIKEVLNKYNSNFKELTFEYAADPTYEQNMTFYAILYITFKKFIEAEVFRIVAINSDDIVASI